MTNPSLRELASQHHSWWNSLNFAYDPLTFGLKIPLNNQHPNIQFTMEEESGCKLAFLNVLVARKDERLLTSV